MNDETCWMPATEIAAAVRGKRLSPMEVTQAFLDRISRVNPKLNAYCLVTADIAMEQAREREQAVMRGDAVGPLHGVPVSIKDQFEVPGLPNTKGSLLHKDRIATGWEYAAKRLLAAGGVLLGRTNMPEFGFIPTTDNKLFGKTNNPWDTARTPGGSSGGGAAACAAGIGPVGLTSDGGGSIRIPASFCGVFGLKPTYGRVPRSPGGWPTLTHRGPTTRTVADAALALDVMAGHEPADPFSVADYPGSFLDGIDGGVKGLRVAWSPDLGFAPVEREVRDICARAARAFEELGCVVEEATPDIEPGGPVFGPIASTTEANWLGELSADELALLDEPARAMLEFGKRASGLDVVRANVRRMAMWAELRRFHETYDLLLSPVVSCTAFVHDRAPAVIDGREIPVYGWMPFTQPFNLTGQPAASVPCGSDSQGMPVGLQVVGRAYEDALVLRACRAFEEAWPWAEKRPTL